MQKSEYMERMQRDDDSLGPAELIAVYVQGIDELRAAVTGMTKEQVLVRPVPGKWSTVECVGHLADTEIFFTDRIVRTIALDRPLLMSADETLYIERVCVDRGLALGYLEGQLRARFGGTQPAAVAAIIRAARMPVTIEDLRLGIDTIAPDLATGASRDGWIASLRRELSGLIVVRREGTPSPRPSDRLDRIRRLLDARQVEAAMAEVARLPGAPQAERWTTAAARYVEAHRALDTIEAAAITGNPQAR